MWYDPDYTKKTMNHIDELLNDDNKLLSLLSEVPEEETMRALGYTKKEGK